MAAEEAAALKEPELNKPNLKTNKARSLLSSAFRRVNDTRNPARPPLLSTQSASSLRKEFAQKTSCHGFGRTVDREEPRAIRLFWTSAIVVLSIGLLLSVFLLSYDTFVVRSVRRDFSSEDNDTMYLPDVHICDASLFNRSALQELGFNDTMASYLALTLSPILASHSVVRNKRFRYQLKHDFDKLMEGKTLEQVFDEAVLKCEDIIFRCVHDTARYDGNECCREIFGGRRSVTYSAAMCLSTHKQSRLLKEIFPSQAFGLTIYLRTNENAFKFDSRVISTSVAARRGIIYAVSDEITDLHSIISVAGHFAWPGTWTSAAIALTRTDNTELLSGLLSPHACVPRYSNNYLHLVPGFDVYSRRNCLFASSTAWLQQLVNCSVFVFEQPRIRDRIPNNTCHPDMTIQSKALASQHIKEQRAFSSLYSSCPEDCVVDDYQLVSTTSRFDFENIDDFQSDSDVKYSAIHFFYPSFSYSLIKNHPGSLVKWISDVGGNMSLFIGASLVTLMEFFVFIFRSMLRF